jgi:hypothetical protein
MKKFYLIFVATLLLGASFKTKAQCDLQFSNLVIQVVGAPVVLGPSQCQTTFNADFDITTNSGFKYLFFHSWRSADYPVTPIFDCSSNASQNPGTATQLGTAVDELGKSFLDIGFLNLNTVTFNMGVPVDVTAYFATTFTEDNTVVLTEPSNSPGLTATVTRTGANVLHFSVQNIKIIINQACGSTLEVKTDIWGSNANAGTPKAQCYICGLTQFFNDPSVTGFKNCNNPRQYAIGINSVDPVVKTITYKVYLDANGNGTLEVGTDILAFTSDPIQISAPGGAAPDGYSSGLVSLPDPYSNTQPYSEYNYLILVEGPTLSNSILHALPDPQCIGLPVEFKSFTATRNRSIVALKWETSVEQDNSGFVVERNIGAVWQEISFVPSQAQGGNSSDLLTYTYNDLNTHKGISQYRLRQVDLNGRFKNSEIRSVRGEGQLGNTIVYPNPSSDGKVNVVFEDANVTRNVSVIDMSGRIIKQWRNVTNNNLQIENLSAGVYSIRIVAIETGEQVVEKIVINKR